MGKFDHLGTRSFPAELAIINAIDFHESIGIKRKEARLRYLKDYWAGPVDDISGVSLNTSLKGDFSCAIGNFRIKEMDSVDAHNALKKKYRLYTTTIRHDEFEGVRVSPHVYTRIEELDRLIEAIRELAA